MKDEKVFSLVTQFYSNYNKWLRQGYGLSMGPQDPNGTADPGQPTHGEGPRPRTRQQPPKYLSCYLQQTTSYASYTQATEVTLLFTTTVSHCNAKNTVRVATPDITLGALIY